MSRSPYKFSTVRVDDDESGKNVAPYATVMARDEDGAPANIFFSKEGGLPVSQFILDSNGEKQIWAEPGIYSFSVSGGEFFSVLIAPESSVIVSAESARGPWDASTNTPALTSGVGTAGYYYEVSVPGSTNLDGNTGWLVGDRALFNGSVWTKLPANSFVRGPASSANEQIALFDGVSGKLIKAGQTVAQYFTTYLDAFLVTLYNVFPRQINTFAALSSTPAIVGQRVTTKGHTQPGIGSLTFVAKSGSVTSNGGTRCNSATPNVYWEAERQEYLTFEMFGAVGADLFNDTPAVLATIAACPPGGNIKGGEKFYYINQTIVIPKPINLHFGAKEQCGFMVNPSGSYLGAPYTAAIYLPSQTSSTPSVGDARRTVLSGFTVKPNGSSPAGMAGILNSCTVYFKEVDVNYMAGNGFSTIAGNGSPIPGNANGTTWENCGTYLNGGHGWYALGDDVNQCTHYRSVAAANGGKGFYDDGLLGNTYVGCEVIANNGGYWVTSAKPNRSAFYNCYAEEDSSVVLWEISDRCLRFGTTGALPSTAAQLATAGAAFSASPTSPATIFCSRQMAWAEDASYIGSETGGKWAKFGQEGLAYQHRAGGRVFRVKDISANAAGIYWDNDLLIQLYNAAVTRNILPSRPHFPSGFTLFGGGPGIVGSGTTAPTTGSYAAGAIWLHTAPVAGGFIGWVCVSDGAPGTWKTFGAIST